MADANSVLAKTTDAHDEASRLAGVPTTAEQLAAKDAQIATLQGKIDAATTAAKADMAADVANVAGKGVLDALA